MSTNSHAKNKSTKRVFSVSLKCSDEIMNAVRLVRYLPLSHQELSRNVKHDIGINVLKFISSNTFTDPLDD